MRKSLSTTAITAAIQSSMAQVQQSAENSAAVMGVGEALGAYISPTQVEALESFCALALAHDIERDTFAAATEAIIRAEFARPLDYDTWREIAAQIKHGVGQYAYRCLVASYKLVHGALPTAGKGTGAGRSGTTTISAKRWFASVELRAVDLTEFVAKMPADVATSKRAEMVGKLLAELNAELGALGRAIQKTA